MTDATNFNGPWREENLETLRALECALAERVKAGDLRARPTLQVVVAFIAELERPEAAAGLDV